MSGDVRIVYRGRVIPNETLLTDINELMTGERSTIMHVVISRRAESSTQDVVEPRAVGAQANEAEGNDGADQEAAFP